MKPLKYFLFYLIFICFPSFASPSDLHPKQSSSGLYGYADEKENFIIAPRFEKALRFESGVARVIEKNNWGLIDQKGNYKLGPFYFEIQEVKNNTLVVAIKKGLDLLYGLYEISGKELIRPQYNYITPGYNNEIFITGNKIIEKNGKEKIRFGVANSKNASVVPLEFKEIKHTRFRTFAVKGEDNYWKFYNADGKEMLGKDYLAVNDFDERSATVLTSRGWAIVAPDGKYLTEGFYRKIIKKSANIYELLAFPHIKVTDNKHNIIFSTQYAGLNFANEKLFIFNKDDKYGLLNEKGEVLIDNKYDDIQPFKNGLSVIKDKNRFGAINLKQQLILQPVYEKIIIDSANGLLKTFENNHCQVFNRWGKAVTPVQYEEIKVQRYAMMLARQGKQWFLQNSDGKIIGNNSYDYVNDFQDLHAIAIWKNGAGLIDTKGNWVVEPVFDSLKIISSHLVITFSNGIYNIINVFNKKIQHAVEKFVPVHSNFFIITKGGKQGLINYRGQEIIPSQYNFISDFSKDSILTVKKDQKWGLIDLKGNIILKTAPACEEMKIMQEERVAVKIKNKYGFFDKEGGLRIANRYVAVQNFNEGMCAFYLKGKWGFINKAEEIIIQPQYDLVESFKNNIVLVKKNNKWGILNKQGQEILKPQFEKIIPLGNGKFISESAGKKGLIGANGNEIIPVGFDILQETPDNYFIVRKNNKYGLLNPSGLEAIPIMYDKISGNGSNYIISIEESPKRLEIK